VSTSWGDADRLVAGTIRHLRSLPRQPLRATVAGQSRTYERAVVLVRAFYLLGLMLLIVETNQWTNLRAVATVDPLWPAWWVDTTDPGRHIDAILIAHAGATALAAFLPRLRTARVLVSLTLFQYLSVKFGFGKINHSSHAWLFTSVVFILLPTARSWRTPTPQLRRNVLQVVWSAQAILLFTYTLTGLWKFYYAIDAVLFSSNIGAFHPQGFSLIIAQDLLLTNRATLLGEWFVEHRWVGWMLFNGTIYLQLTSLLASLRPRLHRLWGAGLIAFHFGTQLAMGFTFVPNIVLLGLFLVLSPWAPDRAVPLEVVADLPGIRLVLRTWQRVQARRTPTGAGS
jgi:hypothetical protein